MFEGILTLLVWTVATVAYVSYVREGQRGFRRLVAFWLGFPWTFCCAFVVQRNKRLTDPRRDEGAEEQALLMEIRRDRALRVRSGKGGGEAADKSEDQKA